MNKLQELYAKIVATFKRAYQKRRKIEKILGQLVVYALLITISYVFLFPLIKMVTLAFMSSSDIIDPEIDFIPKNPTFTNFAVSMKVLDGFRSLWSTIWVSTVLAVAQTIVSALTGFAFARYEFKFKNILFVLILISFIIPVPVMLIPRMMMISTVQNFMINIMGFESFRLLGTIIPQLVLAMLGQGVNSAILILIFYNFFRMIPKVLYEAAKIDGASPLNQFWHITIKISISTIIVVFLFSFVWNWNETYVTGLFNSNYKSLPSQLGVFDENFRTDATTEGGGGESRLNEAYKMAATLISMIPLFIIYFSAQKQFIEGIESTGITGE